MPHRFEAAILRDGRFISGRCNFLFIVGVLAAVLAVAGACSPRTDFDRPTMSTINPNVIRNWGSYSGLGEDGERLSNFKMTRKEEEMRELGYRLLTPLGRRPYAASIVGARRYANRRYEERPLSSGLNYYRGLRNGHERTAYSIWTRLIDDIQADEVSALRFAPAIQRVLQMDFDRHQVFLARGELDTDELQNLTMRLTENRRYGDMVAGSIEDRIAAYKYAVERARVEAPSDSHYEVTLAIKDLEDRFAEVSAALSYDYSRANANNVLTARAAPLVVIQAPIIDQSLN